MPFIIIGLTAGCRSRSGLPLNLTLVISSLGVGGAERVLSMMANHWAYAGRSVTILSYEEGSEPPFYCLRPDVKHVPLGVARCTGTIRAAALANVSRIRRLRRAISESEPHCIISFMDSVNVTTLIATAGLRLPVIVSERSYPPLVDIPKIWGFLRRLTYPLADAVVVQTESTRNWFSKGVRRKTVVIPNPVRCSDGALEDPSTVDEGPKRVISIGRMTQPKRFDLLIRAFASVAESHECELTIVGDGPDRQSLERLSDDLGVRGRVHFTGLVKDPRPLLRAADVFVLPSEFEGFPNALLEAMACGLAVISFDCPVGPRAIITDGVDGILLGSQTVESLAGALDRLLRDDAERKRLAKRALDVNERFSMDRVMKAWDDLISDVCTIS